MENIKRTLTAHDEGNFYVVHASFGDVKQNPYFSVTGEVYSDGCRDAIAAGCIHDEILEHFPELRPLIKLHLRDEFGRPMHMEENANYWLEKDDYGNLAKHLHITPAQAKLLDKDSLKNKLDKLLPIWINEAKKGYSLLASLPNVEDINPYENFLNKKGVSLKVEDESVNGNSLKFKVKIKYNKRSASFDFSCGFLYKTNNGEPFVSDVVSSLFMDSESVEEYDLEEWMRELGFTDIKESKKMYNACKANDKKLQRLFADDYKLIQSPVFSNVL